MRKKQRRPVKEHSSLFEGSFSYFQEKGIKKAIEVRNESESELNTNGTQDSDNSEITEVSHNGGTGLRREKSLSPSLAEQSPEEEDDEIHIITEIRGPRKKQKVRMEPETINLLDDDVEVIEPIYSEEIDTTYTGTQDEVVVVEATPGNAEADECSIVFGATKEAELQPGTSSSLFKSPIPRHVSINNGIFLEKKTKPTKACESIIAQKTYETDASEQEKYDTRNIIVDYAVPLPRLPKLSPRPDIANFFASTRLDLTNRGCQIPSDYRPFTENVCSTKGFQSICNNQDNYVQNSSMASNKQTQPDSAVEIVKSIQAVQGTSLDESIPPVVQGSKMSQNSTKNEQISQSQLKISDCKEDAHEMSCAQFPKAATRKRKAKGKPKVVPCKEKCPLSIANGWLKGDIWYIECIVDSKVKVFDTGERQCRYKVKWEEWDRTHNSWLSKEDFVGSTKSLEEYWNKNLTEINLMNRPGPVKMPSPVKGLVYFK